MATGWRVTLFVIEVNPSAGAGSILGVRPPQKNDGGRRGMCMCCSTKFVFEGFGCLCSPMSKEAVAMLPEELSTLVELSTSDVARAVEYAGHVGPSGFSWSMFQREAEVSRRMVARHVRHC